MNSSDILNMQIEEFVEKVTLLHKDTILWEIKPENVFIFAQELKNNGITHLNVIIALDSGNNLELRYVFFIKDLNNNNLKKGVLKVTLSSEDTIIPSIQSIYPVAVYHEREAFDMFGIKFEPKKRIHRILLPDPLPQKVAPVQYPVCHLYRPGHWLDQRDPHRRIAADPIRVHVLRTVPPDP